MFHSAIMSSNKRSLNTSQGESSVTNNSVLKDCGKKRTDVGDITDEEDGVEDDEEDYTFPDSCNVCHKEFEKDTDLIRHIHDHHWLHAQMYECDVCDVKVDRLYKLAQHRKDTHVLSTATNGLIVCPEDKCGRQLSSVYTLEDHIWTVHKPEQVCLC